MKILVFYVDKQYFNMVIWFLRLRVRRELIIRRDGRAVEGTGLENRRCESIRGFESHSLRHSVSHKAHGSLMIKLDSGLAQVTTQYAEVLKLVTRRPC